MLLIYSVFLNGQTIFFENCIDLTLTPRFPFCEQKGQAQYLLWPFMCVHLERAYASTGIILTFKYIVKSSPHLVPSEALFVKSLQMYCMKSSKSEGVWQPEYIPNNAMPFLEAQDNRQGSLNFQKKKGKPRIVELFSNQKIKSKG